MSPEQLEACNPAHERKPEELDGRSDLYSLAFLLWELLHGERPFAAEELPSGWSAMLAEMAKRRRLEEPPASERPRDPLTARLESVLRKSLAPDPADRHPDGTAMARELLLCLNSRAWDLVHDLQTGWRNWARRKPILALFPINLPPFALASLYNLIYNWKEFIEGKPDAVIKAFWMMCGPLNTVLFSLGIFLVLYYAWPVATALQCLNQHGECDAQQLQEARQRSMRLGHWVAGVGLTLWLVAGISFPIGMHMLARTFPMRGYIHFPLSMLMCGLISFCFPFLATTWLSVRVFIPALLASSAPDVGEQRQLLALSRQAGYYVVVAAVVPMLASLLLALSGREVRVFTIVLIVAGIAGFIAAYITYQRIRDDLAALSVVTRPPEMIGTTTDSVSTF
jgi:eukaryotic-like serine/threonine-protein kinase